PLPELENPLPDQGRLVRRAIHATNRASAGQPSRRSVRAAHGCTGLPVLRWREALDGHAGRLPAQAARGYIQGVSAAAGAAGLQSWRDARTRDEGGRQRDVTIPA